MSCEGSREQRPCPRPWALARPSLAYMGHARRRKSSAGWGDGARAGAAATNRPRASTLGGKALEIASGGCHGLSRILEGGHEAAYLYSRSRPLGKRLPPVRHRWNCVRRSKSAGRVGGGARNGARQVSWDTGVMGYLRLPDVVICRLPSSAWRR